MDSSWVRKKVCSVYLFVNIKIYTYSWTLEQSQGTASQMSWPVVSLSPSSAVSKVYYF